MTSRYLERYRLPGSRYTKASPAILLAGALLEDTQRPRLVVQLKFKSISPRMLAGLTVAVRCFDGMGDEIESKEFTYENLHVRRGQSFGGYTAIVLPVSGARRFTAVVTSAVFSDGGRWACAEDGAVVPTAAAPIAASPAQEAAGIETAKPTLVAPTAAEAKDPPVAETLPDKSAEITPEKVGRMPGIRGKWLALAAACAAVILAAAIVLPKALNGERNAPAPAGEQTVSSGGALAPAAPVSDGILHVTTDTDYETFSYLYEQDSAGNCYITFDGMKEIFPELGYFAFEGTPRIGDGIDAYLVDSFHMASLVGTRGEAGSDDQYGTYSATNDPASTRCLLLFSDLYTLCGYSIAVPADEGGGHWSLEITRCDYDFRDLYERASADFYSAARPEFVPYNDIPDSGAAYFLYAYNMRIETEQANNTQLFHLWSQYNSEYRHRHAQDIGTLDQRPPREGRIMLYYLLDKDYSLVGYSRLVNNSGDMGAEEIPNVTTPYDTGTVDIDLEEDENGACPLSWETVREYFPQATNSSFASFINLGGDIDAYIADSLHMAYLVGTSGLNGAGTGSVSYRVRNDSIRPYCLLLFSDDTTLLGYAIGAPEKTQAGVWRLTVTRCNYEFSALYQQKSTAFSRSQKPPYIAPEEVETSGAKWILYLSSYFIGANMEQDISRFHVWNQLASPYLDHYLKETSSFGDSMPSSDFGDWVMTRYYYLLDENRNLMGYTEVFSDRIDTSANTAVRAPQNVRFEIAGNGVLQLVWDKPTWATEDTYALVEAKRTADSAWTLVNRVRVDSETSRSVSSLILHWSEPRSGDRYEFRIRFAERDEIPAGEGGGYMDYTDYAQCPGVLTVSVGTIPLVVAAQSGNNTLTVRGAFHSNREYFIVFDHPTHPNSDYRSWKGFVTGASSITSYEFTGDDFAAELSGGRIYAWELTNPTQTDNNASIRISAMPEAVTIVSSSP